MRICSECKNQLNITAFPKRKFGKRGNVCRKCMKLKKEEKKLLFSQGQQRCIKCSKVKDLSEFYRSSENKSGYDGHCKECELLRKFPEAWFRKQMFKIGYSQCTKCKIYKSISEFHKQSRSEKGIASWCKSCTKIYHVAYYTDNKDYVNKRNREWKEEQEDYDKKYYQDNIEYLREQARNYSKNNPEIWKKNNRKYRVRKNNSKGSHTDEEFRVLCEKYNFFCLRCMKQEGSEDFPPIPSTDKRKLTEDHVTALKNGGSDYISNIQPLCYNCNASKGNRNSTDYRAVINLPI